MNKLNAGGKLEEGEILLALAVVGPLTEMEAWEFFGKTKQSLLNTIERSSKGGWFDGSHEQSMLIGQTLSQVRPGFASQCASVAEIMVGWTELLCNTAALPNIGMKNALAAWCKWNGINAACASYAQLTDTTQGGGDAELRYQAACAIAAVTYRVTSSLGTINARDLLNIVGETLFGRSDNSKGTTGAVSDVQALQGGSWPATADTCYRLVAMTTAVDDLERYSFIESSIPYLLKESRNPGMDDGATPLNVANTAAAFRAAINGTR